MASTLTLAAVASFLCVALLTPLAGRVARRMGLVDKPGPKRAHFEPTPYLGGIAIVAGLLVGVVAVRAAVELEFRRQLLVIALGTVAMAGVGLLDDWRPSLPRWRIASQAAAAAAVIAVGVELRVTPWRASNVALTLIWIVGITNATNLLDNIDGLASGAVAIAAAGCAYLAVDAGQVLVSVMAVATAAAALGFLVHNRPPARIFMGDTGALALGFLLAVTVAKLDLVEEPGPLRLAVVSLLCGVGILDTILVVLSRLGRGISPFTGGTDHSSHRLVRWGLSPGRAVLVLHGLSAWFVASGILVRYSGTGVALAGIVLAGALMVAALWGLLRLPAEGPLAQRELAASDGGHTTRS